LKPETFKKIFAGIVVYSGVLYLFTALKRLFAKPEVTILMYHRVTQNKQTHLDHSVISATIEQFEKQMQYLHEHCTVLSFDDFFKFQKGGLPRNSVIITFDDGYKDNYLYAYPILTKYHLKATIFLITGYIDRNELFWWDKIAYVIKNTNTTHLDLPHLGRVSLANKEEAIRFIQNHLKQLNDSQKNRILNYLDTEYAVIPTDTQVMLSWQDIKEMNKENITMGCHTVSHAILTRVSFSQARTEILNSKAEIEKHIGQRVHTFAYPNGRLSDFNDDIISILKEADFECAVTTMYGTNSLLTDVFRLRRIAIRTDDDQSMFKIKLAGFGRIFEPIYMRLFMG